MRLYLHLIAFLLLVGLSEAAARENGMPGSRAGIDVASENGSQLRGDRKETAEGQGEADVQITRNIRKELLASKLSTNAKNVKIITLEGNVTLKGAVKTAEEREQVVATAKRVAGEAHVTDRLEIAK